MEGCDAIIEGNSQISVVHTQLHASQFISNDLNHDWALFTWLAGMTTQIEQHE